MKENLTINDFFNPDGTLPKDANVKFENLIKYLDYLKTKKNGYFLAYCDILEFFRANGGCFENYTAQIIKEGLLEGTICLKFGEQEYIYTLPIELVWLLKDNICGRPEKLEEQIVESYGMQFENCSLNDLLESLGKNRDASKYIRYYYFKYEIEIGILPFLLANHNFDVVKWTLDNLTGFSIETDKVEDWEEEDSDEDEEDRIFEKYNVNISGLVEEEVNMMKALVYFLVNEGQSPEIIEYICAHIKSGREILEDERVKKLSSELLSENPDFSSIFSGLDYLKTKALLKVQKSETEGKIEICSFGGLSRSYLKCAPQCINEVSAYLEGEKHA